MDHLLFESHADPQQHITSDIKQQKKRRFEALILICYVYKCLEF